MRFSAATAVTALLPALSAAAQESSSSSPLHPYKVQFREAVEKLVSYIPNPGKSDPVAFEAVKNGPMKLSVLSLENWRPTLYESVAAGASEPEEWWVLITGRNKSCYGHCLKLETAFNETAAKFAELPGAPHMALVNCDDQPILCSSWSVTPGNIFDFHMLPPPAPVDIYKRRFNLTSTTSEDLVKLQATGSREFFSPLDSWFHPINGAFTELGLSVLFGYLMWGFGLIPQWALMLIVSMVSRTIMSNRVSKQAAKPNAAAAAQKKTQ